MNDYWNLDFSDIYGAGTGDVQGSQDIMSQLADLLESSGRKDWEDYDWAGSSKFGDPSSDRANYSLGDWENYLTNLPNTSSGDQTKRMGELLLDMLKGAGISDLSKEYGQDRSDISSEMLAQRRGLQKGYTSGTKSGRYSKMGTGGRSVGKGGRSKYMSDIYGLQQREAEMESSLQERFTDDFYGNLATWQGLNPSPYIEE